jgi:zinc transporter, ZIP family
MPLLLKAGLLGLLSTFGLLAGAAIAVCFYERLSHRVIAAVMGFGGGVLIAVLSMDLMEKAFAGGGPLPAVVGLLLGAFAFSALNWWLSRRGARHRNRCGECVQQPSESHQRGSGLAIALGAILDGIPESLVIGVSVLEGGNIGVGLVAGFFLANVPQGLSSTSGMKKAGRSTTYIFVVWTGIAVVSGLAAAIGAFSLGSSGPLVPAIMLSFAAGGVLSMLAESMIPEAFENSQPFTGLVTVVGFLAAFLIIKAEV